MLPWLLATHALAAPPLTFLEEAVFSESPSACADFDTWSQGLEDIPPADGSRDCGDPGTDLLAWGRACLADGSRDPRAAFVVGAFGDEGDVDRLIPVALAGEAAAMDALGALRSPVAIEVLSWLACGQPPFTRADAMCALAIDPAPELARFFEAFAPLSNPVAPDCSHTGARRARGEPTYSGSPLRQPEWAVTRATRPGHSPEQLDAAAAALREHPEWLALVADERSYQDPRPTGFHAEERAALEILRAAPPEPDEVTATLAAGIAHPLWRHRLAQVAADTTPATRRAVLAGMLADDPSPEVRLLGASYLPEPPLLAWPAWLGPQQVDAIAPVATDALVALLPWMPPSHRGPVVWQACATPTPSTADALLALALPTTPGACWHPRGRLGAYLLRTLSRCPPFVDRLALWLSTHQPRGCSSDVNEDVSQLLGLDETRARLRSADQIDLAALAGVARWEPARDFVAWEVVDRARRAGFVPPALALDRVTAADIAWLTTEELRALADTVDPEAALHLAAVHERALAPGRARELATERLDAWRCDAPEGGLADAVQVLARTRRDEAVERACACPDAVAQRPLLQGVLRDLDTAAGRSCLERAGAATP